MASHCFIFVFFNEGKGNNMEFLEHALMGQSKFIICPVAKHWTYDDFALSHHYVCYCWIKDSDYYAHVQQDNMS